MAWTPWYWRSVVHFAPSSNPRCLLVASRVLYFLSTVLRLTDLWRTLFVVVIHKTIGEIMMRRRGDYNSKILKEKRYCAGQMNYIGSFQPLSVRVLVCSSGYYVGGVDIFMDVIL
jgi:hypothetical protein